MVMCVKLFIDRGALDPEIGAQINHFASEAKQRSGKFGGDSVGKREKDHLCLPRQQARLCPAYCREVTAVNSVWG